MRGSYHFSFSFHFHLSVVNGFNRVKAQEEKPEDLQKKEAEKRATQLLLLKADEEYRTFFRRPEKVPEFWAAIKFEIGVGKFDLAAMHLKMLLQKEPAADVDKELLKIENADGLASFVRLAEHPQMER